MGCICNYSRLIQGLRHGVRSLGRMLSPDRYITRITLIIYCTNRIKTNCFVYISPRPPLPLLFFSSSLATVTTASSTVSSPDQTQAAPTKHKQPRPNTSSPSLSPRLRTTVKSPPHVVFLLLSLLCLCLSRSPTYSV